MDYLFISLILNIYFISYILYNCNKLKILEYLVNKKREKNRNRNKKRKKNKCKKETNFNEYYFTQRTLTRSNSFPSNDRIEQSMINSLFIDKSKDTFLPEIYHKMNQLNNKIKWFNRG